MEAKLYGMTRQRHVVSLVVHAVFLLMLIALAVLSVMIARFGPLQWTVAGFLVLSSALWVAWEIRALFLFRAGRVDGQEPSVE